MHVNIYKDGSVGVDPHSDNEDAMVEGMDIYSYTILEEQITKLPRDFCIYKKDKVTKLYSVPLLHQDLLIMKDMQRNYTHSIDKQRPIKDFSARVNLTVRAFRPATCS